MITKGLLNFSEFSSFNKKQQGLYQNSLFYTCTASKFWKNLFAFGGQILRKGEDWRVQLYVLCSITIKESDRYKLRIVCT